MQALYRGAVIIILLMGFAAKPALADGDIVDLDWSINAEKPLNKYPPIQQEVEKFINRIQDTDWNVKVCSYKFVNFNKDGSFYLVASLDMIGRHACNEIVVIGKKGSSFSIINRFKAWMVEDISDALRDLDNDGISELVFPQAWSEYEGAGHCQALWGKVYQWKDWHLVDNDASYPELYKTRMKELEILIPRTTDPSCRQMELDKIMRFLHQSPTAGFDRAVEWMKSSDRFLRRKAAAVFADINDQPSRKNLIALTQDPEPLVAESAKIDLETANQH